MAERSRQFLDLRQRFQEKVRAKRASALAGHLVDHLFKSPAITVPLARELLKITYPSANPTVQKLVEAGILHEISGHKRNRVWLAPQVLEILSKRPDRQADMRESSH